MFCARYWWGATPGIPDWMILVSTLGGIAALRPGGDRRRPDGSRVVPGRLVDPLPLRAIPRPGRIRKRLSDVWRSRPSSQEEQVGRLILAGVLVLFLPALPFGNFLIWPFVILTTWFHEMGHGLTALVTGNAFDLLVINADGSGFASSRTALEGGGLGPGADCDGWSHSGPSVMGLH